MQPVPMQPWCLLKIPQKNYTARPPFSHSHRPRPLSTASPRGAVRRFPAWVCDRFRKLFMALILGFLILPLPSPSAKSMLQSRSPSRIPAAYKNQFARCFPGGPSGTDHCWLFHGVRKQSHPCCRSGHRPSGMNFPQDAGFVCLDPV